MRPLEPAFSSFFSFEQPIGVLPHRTVDQSHCGRSMNRASVAKDASSSASSLPNADGMIFPERLLMLWYLEFMIPCRIFSKPLTTSPPPSSLSKPSHKHSYFSSSPSLFRSPSGFLPPLRHRDHVHSSRPAHRPDGPFASSISASQPCVPARHRH